MLCLHILLLAAAMTSPTCAPRHIPNVPSATPSELGTLLPLPPAHVDCPRLGVACAINDTSLLLADDGQRDGPAVAGFIACSLNTPNGWKFTEVLRAPSALQGDQFGTSIALDGDCLVVGAPGDAVAGVPGGTAWAFRFIDGAWHAESSLPPSAPSAGANYGYAVALQGDCAVVAAPRHNLDGHWHVGRVEIFHCTNRVWKRAATIDPPFVATSLWFGYDVALTANGSRLAIGVPGLDTDVDRGGGVVLAEREGHRWRLVRRPVHRLDATPLERFGSAVAATGSTFLVSAPGAEPDATGLLAAVSIDAPQVLLGAWIHPAVPQGRLGTTLATSTHWAAATIPGWRSKDGTLGAVRLFQLNHDRPLATFDVCAAPGGVPIGRAIALSDELLVVTAVPNEDDLAASPEAWLIPLLNMTP